MVRRAPVSKERVSAAAEGDRAHAAQHCRRGRPSPTTLAARPVISYAPLLSGALQAETIALTCIDEGLRWRRRVAGAPAQREVAGVQQRGAACRRLGAGFTVAALSLAGRNLCALAALNC